MKIYDIILKKRDGNCLSEKEIRYLINNYVSGKTPDYQIAAWSMAVFFRGLNIDETIFLTKSIINSGEVINLSSIPGIKIDKHSTGGVGDKTTLVLVPLAAAAGVRIPKMSGRGLGHTGGTLDKLESIPGFNVNLKTEDLIQQIRDIGCAIFGQTENLVPADKKLYSLRDVTATVDIIPFIASSIMSKKIAAGADKIVLDIKIGSGAFIKNIEQGIELAKLMVAIGNNMGKETRAVLTSMDQPLGFAVGNALEVKEAVETLQGKGPKDLTELCLELGARMLLLEKKASNKEKDLNSLKERLNDLIYNGSAFNKFKEIIKYQGGDLKYLTEADSIKLSTLKANVFSEKDGYVNYINTHQLGNTAMILGAGRIKLEDKIDHSVGLRLFKKKSDWVSKGELIAEVYAADKEILEKSVRKVKEAYYIESKKKEKSKLIIDEIF